MTRARKLAARSALLCASVLLYGCGGGGGGGSSPPPPPPAPATYAVGGSIIGLRGTGLVLQNNGGDPLPVGANGSFTFATNTTSGGAYNVTVRTQPTAAPAQTCTVASGSGTVSATVTTVTVNCRAQSGRYLYVVNSGNGTLSGFSIDIATGALAEIAGSPFAVGGAKPRFLAADPTGNYLFILGGATDSSPGTLMGYAVNAGTGAVTAVPGMPLAFPQPLWPATFNATGRLLYLPVGAVPGNSDSAMYGFLIESATGALTAVPGSPYHATGNPFVRNAAFGSGEKYLYVPQEVLTFPSSNSIAIYAVNSTTGELTAQAPLPVADFMNDIAIHPGGKFLYTRTGSSETRVYAVDGVTGALTGGSTPVPSGIGLGFTFAVGGKFVYTIGQDTVQIAGGGVRNVPGGAFAFSVDQTSGALTALSGSPFSPGGMNNFGMTTDPTGGYLVMSSMESATVTVFAIDSATGGLSHIAGSPFTPSVGTKPGAVVFDPSARFAYLPDYGTNSVSAYRVDVVTGAPAFVGSYATGPSPTGLLVIVGAQ